ncbi:MAG TPA: T9SS type A sorting domain-containing protein, partial [Flavobacterium sp.]
VQSTEAAIEADTYGPGTYVIRVSYPNGNNPPGNEVCSTTQEVEITQPDAIIVSAENTPIPCLGGFSTITVSATGGTGPYTYSIDGMNYQPDPTFSVTAGAYTVYVKDSQGCINSDSEVVPEGPSCANEGCTLGYWKNHTDRWCSNYTTCMTIGEVFDNEPAIFTNLTLLEALNLGGGDIYNLARQGVAALLNTCSDAVDYPSPYFNNTQSVIDAVNAAFLAGGDAPGSLASQLDILNNSGCPLGGSEATSMSNCVSVSNARVSDPYSFTAYPVPFKEQLTVSYNYDFVTEVKIEVFNSKGEVVASATDTNLNNSITLNIPNTGLEQEELYIVKVTTNRGSSTQKILSSR